MRKILALLFFILLLTGRRVYAQQDAQQSQYMFNLIYINPAYAGYKENFNFQAFYRSQWTDITGGPVTSSFAIDGIANNGNVGLALEISNDKLGAQTNFLSYVNYAYRLRMNEDGSARLALGLGVGIVNPGINGALLDPNYQEPNQPAGTQSMIVPDGRIGVFYSDNTYYAGLSADNLIAQYISVKASSYLAQPEPHYYLTAGMLVPLTEDILVKPSILLKDDIAGPTSLDINAFLLFGQKLWIGGSYRTGIKLYNKSNLQSDLTQLNSAVAAIEFFPYQNLRIGYAYDFSIGPLQGYSGGTHEISIGFYLRKKNNRMLSPRFF